MPTATLDRPKPVLGKTTPRIYTPPLKENCDRKGKLRDDRTHGHAAIRFAKELLDLTLYPWQEWLLVHALELVEDENGNDVYRFRIVIVCAARQNGKTTVEIILALWHLFALGSRTIIGTAQDLSKADDTWKDVVAMAEADPTGELGEFIDPAGIFLGHPKSFTLTTGCEYRVASATRGGGRGFSGDFILIDELREHSNFESWSAVTNTMNARPRGQAWAFSNAGDATSVVLRRLRAQAHRDLGWPDGEQEFEGVLDEMDEELVQMLAEMEHLKPGWFEWSAPPSAKRNDLDALAQSNPSLNHSDVTLDCPTTRTLLSALASNPAYEYETEVMCRWASMGVGGPFPEGSWEGTCSRVKATPESKKVVCVELSTKRNQTYVARMGLASDGNPVVGIRYDHPGTEWVVGALLADRDSTEKVVVRTEGGSSALEFYKKLKRELTGIPIVEMKSSDVDVAHQQLFNRLRDRTVWHLPHSGLDMAATSAVSALKPGGSFRIDIKRSPSDVAPLYAVIGALWGMEEFMGDDYDITESVL